MPSQSPERFATPWKLDGPLPSGVLLIRDAGGYCVATVKVDPACPLACHVIAGLLTRTPNRAAILEHVLTELQADDEGARHEDLTTLIKREIESTVAFSWPASPDAAAPAPKSADDLVEGFNRLAREANTLEDANVQTAQSRAVRPADSGTVPSATASRELPSQRP